MTTYVNKQFVSISEADLSTTEDKKKKIHSVNQIVNNMKICNKKVIDPVL